MYTLCHKDFVRAGGSLVPRAATSAHVPTATPTFLSAPFARSSIQRSRRRDAHKDFPRCTECSMDNGAARRSRTRCGTKNADGDARIGS